MNKQTDLSSFNNSWYKPGRNFIVRGFWYCKNATVFKSSFPFNGIKIFWLRFYGAKIGTGVVIKPGVNIKYPWRLTIGNNVWIGEKVCRYTAAQKTLTTLDAVRGMAVTDLAKPV